MNNILTIWDLLEDAAKDKNRSVKQYIDLNNDKVHDRMDLYEDSKAMALYFQENIKGDKVGFLCSTTYEFLVGFFGCIGSGKTTVIINSALPDEMIAELLLSTETYAVVYDINVLRIEHIEKHMNSKLKAISTYESVTCITKVIQNYLGKEFISELVPEAMAVIAFTSGTTGKMKGVMLSHKNLVTNVFDIHNGTDYTIDDRVVSLLPPSHVFGLNVEVLLATYLGIELVFEKNTAAAFKCFKRTEPTVLIMVPMMVDLLAAKLTRVEDKIPGAMKEIVKESVTGSRLRAIGCGGAKSNHRSILKLAQYEINCRPGYGMTELSPAISINQNGFDNPFADGLLVESLKIRIKDGEIQLQGPTIAMGYYKNEEEWKNMWDGDWFKTGDIGYLNEKNMIVLTGRVKNLIITSSGENISPEYIEEKYKAFPQVSEVVVKADGDLIEAVIYCARGMEQVEADNITREINKTLPVFSRIQKTSIRAQEFPINISGKILRNIV